MKQFEIMNSDIADLSAVYLFLYSRVAENKMWSTKVRLIACRNGDVLSWESKVRPDPSWPQGDRFGPFADDPEAEDAGKVALQLTERLMRVQNGIIISNDAKGTSNMLSKLMKLGVAGHIPSFEITDDRDLTAQQKEEHKELLIAAEKYHQADMDQLIEELTGE